MTTFAIALGVSGTLNYHPDYKSGSVVTGDFADIRTGAQNWPLWPDPLLDYYPTLRQRSLWNNPKSIDDFWHTAVNGRGYLLQRGEPDLGDRRPGRCARRDRRRASRRGSAAATSNLEPVSGDNLIYLASYTTQKWTGDVQAQGDQPRDRCDRCHRDLVGSGPARCPHRQRLRQPQHLPVPPGRDQQPDATSPGTPASATPPATRPGCCPTASTRAEQAHFGAVNVVAPEPVPGDDRRHRRRPSTSGRPAAGANLVNFLRGQRGLEGFITNDVDQAVPGPRARARRHRQRPADLRAGAVQPLRRPGLRGLQDAPTRAAPRCSTFRATTACCTPSTPAPAPPIRSAARKPGR